MSKKDIEKLRKDAEQGDAEAQYLLGKCYDEGDGVNKDYVEAAKWYRKAAEQGHVDSQYNLGSCYFFGDGVTQDYAETAKWWKKSAGQGHLYSIYDLGSLYFWGNGVAQDYAEAVKWYRKAAEQGNADAQFMLGECYIYGRGAEQSETEAVKWYRKAAKQGYKDAENALQEINNGTKIKVLNIVLRKEFALEIVRGEKVREYRWFSDFWAKRLCLFEDPKNKNLITGLKWYDRVHFYPYNNKWFVDCVFEDSSLVTVDAAFQEKYKDEVIANIGEELFVIELGQVIATNLEAEAKKQEKR